MDEQVKYPSRVDMMNPQYVLLSIVAIAFIAGVSDADSDDLTPLSLVGAFAAEDAEFPYMASLRTNGVHFCGGSILDARHVLTAAHCVYFLSFPYNTTVVATGSVWEDEGRLHDIKSITNHPRFNMSQDPYDIAIIVLNQNITFDHFQTSVALQDGPTPSGVMATVIGWGKTQPNARLGAPYLRKLDIMILGYNECLERLDEGAVIEEDSEICCLSPRGTGACQGDSGGPLVYNGHLIGIVIGTYACAEGYPEVYANVSFFVPWIREKIAETYRLEGVSAALHIGSTHFQNILKAELALHNASSIEEINP